VTKSARGRGSGHVRIVAGAARGRVIAVPRGDRVRPTPDRVREALFSILGERVEAARVLDACAGTGALGLEAASRGAAEVVLIERDRVVAETLRENVGRVGLPTVTVVVRDARPALRDFAAAGRSFDIVLLDPPFEAGLWGEILAELVRGALVAPGGVVVAEHPTATASPAVGGLHLTGERHYGSVALSFFERDP
jgi:16S rRNA (guanine(966)-N(2))-methyltransferase RsmD